MRFETFQEETYVRQMRKEAEPYLAQHGQTFEAQREEGRGIACVRYLAEEPRGIVMISHGYTESAEKYKEILYYFVREGYHVYMPEHCGHGRSYRLQEDMSLVHVDDYQRYVDDFLFVTELAAQEQKELPMYLYGHSMGGAIAAAAAAQRPEAFAKIVLSSPMIRPLTGGVPWGAAKLLAVAECAVGREKEYVIGTHPYDGMAAFENSSSMSEARFSYYQSKRREEPLYQGNAPSYGWIRQAARLNHYLQTKAWRRIMAPLILFQAEHDTLVSDREQERFVRRMAHLGRADARLVKVPGLKHEIFNSGDETVKKYWKKVFAFLEE